MQVKNILKIGAILGLFFSLSSLSYASNNLFVVDAENSFAGIDTYISSSTNIINTDLYFNVENPKGEVVRINTKTNNVGFAKSRLTAEYTKTSGTYRVSAHIPSENLNSPTSFFKIFPSTMSMEKSFITPKDLLANTNETVSVKLTLLDSFQNPINNRYIKLVPSDTGLSYETKALLTNDKGIVEFFISSSSSKAYSLSFFDVSSNSLIDLKVNVAFVNSDSSFILNAGNSSGPATVLKFENFPNDIGVLEYVSFTVSAYDSMNQLVNDYRGRVRFSVVSDNVDDVILPSDYGFVTSDQGSHTFSLALLFKKEGDFKISVQDMNNANLKGEIDLSVGKNGFTTPSNSSIIIESPLSGTYNSNIQTISGTSQPASKLKIFDNNILLSTITADFEGKFSYTTNPLVSGEHTLYVSAFDSNDVEIDRSIEVNFVIDTDGPKIVSENITNNSTFEAGADINYSISVDKTLSSAKVYFNNDVFDLSKEADNIYSINLKAPLIAGTYTLGLELKDSLQNEYRNLNKLNFIITEKITNIAIVENLKAVGSDKRVILTWDNPSNLEDIDFYRIYYGFSPNELINAVDTFTSSNTWYVPNLQNGVRYYFKVKAIGLDGSESPELSSIASAEAVLNISDPLSPDILHGVAGSDILSEMESDVSNTGPALNFLILFTIILSVLFNFRKKLFY